MSRPDFFKYKVISFDIFDTLVTRLLAQPRDVFELVELRAAGQGIRCEGFRDARVAAERSARANGAAEVTLREIYIELGKTAGLAADICDELRDIEEQAELDVCVVKPEGKRLYEAAKVSGVPLVITSDMYLPRRLIENILGNCGYGGWADLFLSCERGATKASGSLYGVVAGAMGVHPSEILHLGDNLKSDILRARRAGLSTFRIEAERPQARGLAESLILGSRFASGVPQRADGSLELGIFGYRALGPVLVGFCQWLTSELIKEGISKVFFLARDGLIIQKTMLALGHESFEETYLYASRRALQVPSFALLDSFGEIVDSMFLPRIVSLRKVFAKAGLDGDTAASEMREIGIDPDIERISATLADDPDALRAYDALAPLIRENSSAELAPLAEYLRQSGFTGRVAIVDIGWFGNMQVALERVCAAAGIDADIYGYYVGLSPDGTNQATHRMRGYLFEPGRDRALFEHERCYNLIFETLFSAVHGTTRGYQRRVDGEMAPVLADYEGVEANVGLEAEKARKGALRFAADWEHVFGNTDIQLEPNLALQELSRVGVEPTGVEAAYFGDWAMEADGGLTYAAKPRSAGFYAAHPKRLVSDFAHASWKVGFLKRLFKAPFPYGKMWMDIHAAWKRRHQ